MSARHSFGALWREATLRLEAANLRYGQGTEDAAQEAAWMLIHVLQLPLLESFARLRALQRRVVPAAAQRELWRLVEARIAGRRPLAYLLGEAWLHGQRFVVDERVIVPRSFIAELLDDALMPWLGDAPRRIVDVCTGSGCLAILAAQRWPQAQVWGGDLSVDALQVAAANVALHHSAVQLCRSDLLRELPADIDLLLCNPPYVNAASMRALPAEFRHEPALALAGGADGMDLVRRLLAQAALQLAPDGIAVVEIGHEREHFEAAFPTLPVVWMATSEPDRVFLVDAAALRAAR